MNGRDGSQCNPESGNTMKQAPISRREVLRGAVAGAAGAALRRASLLAAESASDEPIKRYWLFAHPDGSECPNVKEKGILLVDIDAGLKEGRWTIARRIETPLLSRIPHGNGPGVRGVTICAAANRCYVSCSDGRKAFYLVCVDLGTGKAIYEKEVPGIGRLQITPDGSTVFLPVDWYGGQSACAVDAETADVKKTFEPQYQHHLAIGESGDYVYAPFRKSPGKPRNQQAGLHIIDTRTFKVVREVYEEDPLRLIGSAPHIQVDAKERRVYSYCRMKCAMCLIECATRKQHVVESVKLGDLWADAPKEPLGRGRPAPAESMPSYHGIAFFPDGKRAWVGVEGNCPDLVEFDLTAGTPKATRAIHGGTPRRAKGWAFISRKGDVVYTSNGRMFSAADGKLLGEVRYDDRSPLYSSKLCEVHMRGDKVVFGSSSVACGYPPEEAGGSH